jgi:hypothetical protein
MRLTVLAAAAMGSVVALVGFAGAANASATVDLIWIDKTDTACIDDGRRDCPQLGTTLTSVAVSDRITLAVILTAGPNGSWGAAVSVDYGDALPNLSVADFQSLTTTLPLPYLPLSLGSTTDQPPFIRNINSGAAPPIGQGIGLPAGQSAYLGTVSFHKDLIVNGTAEIAVGTNGPRGADDVLDGIGNVITATTTFNSAFLVDIGDPPPCGFEIEVNALRAGGKTVQVGPNQTVDVTAKARILKGTAPPDTTIDTTLTIEAVDDTGVIDTETSLPITLGVGKGGKGDKLTLDATRCDGGSITFVATFSGIDVGGDVCEGTRALRRACR